MRHWHLFWKTPQLYETTAKHSGFANSSVNINTQGLSLFKLKSTVDNIPMQMSIRRFFKVLMEPERPSDSVATFGVFFKVLPKIIGKMSRTERAFFQAHAADVTLNDKNRFLGPRSSLLQSL